jgi:peptidoglycan/LPS O-acetylase OafA/YrhL
MRIRFLSFISLAVAGGFLVVASQAFTAVDTANLALGVGIGMLVVSMGTAARFRRHRPSFAVGVITALVSAWMIIASQVFSLETVQNLTLAESLAVAGLAIVGLTGHELSTERVVHALSPMRAHAHAEEIDDLREPVAG